MITECDRCADPTPATQVVTCWYGCDHWQCDSCAEQTKSEAQEGTDEQMYECTEDGCHKGPATGHALHRTSPKGQEFEGKCTEHFEGTPDPIAVIIENDNHQ